MGIVLINTVLSSFTFMIFYSITGDTTKQQKTTVLYDKKQRYGQTAAMAEAAMAKQVATGICEAYNYIG